MTVKSNKIVRLVICHKCHSQISESDTYTRYNGSIYCDYCFLDFVNNIELKDLEMVNSSSNSNHED